VERDALNIAGAETNRWDPKCVQCGELAIHGHSCSITEGHDHGQ
jgi:hypothetical protein